MSQTVPQTTWPAVPATRRSAGPQAGAGTNRYAGLMIMCGFATLLSLVATHILPAKYFFDAQEVQQLAQGTYTLPTDSEYSSAGAAYRFFHLQNSPSLVAVITMAIFAVALFTAVRRGRLSAARPSTLAITFASPLLAAIYVAVYSKESIVLVAALIMAWLSKLRHGLWAMLAFALLYAIFFRLYWGLVAGLIPVAYVMLGRRPTYPSLIAFMVLGIGLVAIATGIDQHISLVAVREVDNAGRVGQSDAVTLIPQYISGTSDVVGFLNSVVTLPLLLFPVPLFVHPAPQYWAAAVFMIAVSIRLGGALVRLARRCAEDPTDTAARSALLCACAALALAIVQSVYVPDYGSALKHFTPILPLVVCALVAADTEAADSGDRGIQSGPAL